ncbi:MAG: hypothetical protein GXO08_00165 [Aquificae bacterium]|nr:hypothetical protein [Aquificota bacterium]
MGVKVNRFPKMAALQKFRALRLGYPEELAEAIGVAEAVKYAIFKNLHRLKRQGKEEEAEKLAPEYGSQKETLDWKTFELFKLAAKEGKPFVGGRTYTAADYRRQVIERFGEEVGRKIEEWARRLVEQTPEELLRNEQKFFNKVWKVHRDDPIEV